MINLTAVVVKRRSVLKSLPVLAGAPLIAQSQENFKVESVAPEVAAKPSQRFLTKVQFASLSRLGEALVPAFNERPGSAESQAPLFLDFLISKSPADRQFLYRAGLDRLEAEARKRHGQPFAKISDEQAGAILAPLRESWTYQGPRDGFSRFLHAAKDDLLKATFNSRDFIAAASQTQRGYNGLGYYWLPIE